MATVPRPSTALPDPGSRILAAQVRDWVNAILTFLESTNLDESNVDLTGADGIVGKSTTQTITGTKTFTGLACAGTWENPFVFGPSPCYMWDDNVTGCTRLKRTTTPSSITDGSIIPEV